LINVGVIGTGVMGAGHARFIKEHIPGARVVGLSDIDLSKTEFLSHELGSVLFSTTDPQELMNDSRVDAVVIASPDPLHVSHLRLAIKSNKQILCEKPIATTFEDAKMISDEIRAYEKLVRISSTGATSTGLFTNIAIHDFDIYRWLFNDEWESIKSFYPKRSTLSPEGLDDPLIIIGKLRSGVTMVGDIVAFNNYGFDCRVEVVCEKGSIQIGTHGDVYTQVNGIGGSAKGGKMAENWMARFEKSYIEELKAWIHELSSGEINSDLATVEDALIANEICALGLDSIKG